MKENKPMQKVHQTKYYPCSLVSGLLLIVCALFMTSCTLPTGAAQDQQQTNQREIAVDQKGVTWQIEPMWGQWPDTNWTAVAQDAADIHNANITWARVELHQDYPFAYFDKVVQLANQYHIHLLVLVYKSDPENDLGTQAQRDAYKGWLAQAVSRYKNDVDYWEIQNEENGGDNWNIDATPGSDQGQYDDSVGRFVQLMHDSYETIHANNPDARVLFGGLSDYHAERYIDSMIQHNAYLYMDIMAFHPYASTPKEVVAELNMLQRKMATQPGFASKPIWVTEIGFHTEAEWTNNPGYVSAEAKKAQDLVQTIQLLRANGVQLTFWYTLHESSNVNGYGLTRRDPSTLATTYLPAYDAYKAL